MQIPTKLFAPLGVIALLAIGLLVYSSAQQEQSTNESAEVVIQQNNFGTLPAAEFAQVLEQQDAVLIDLRTPAETQAGKLEGAIELDFYADDFVEQLQKLDKSANYKVYCNSGNRSSQAMQIMRQLGFTSVQELGGGIQAWASSGQDICTQC